MKKKIIVYFLLFTTLTLSLTGCGNSKTVYEEKINAELSYLDTKLEYILNKINGISFESHIIKAEKISTESGSEGSNGGSSEKSSELNQKSGSEDESSSSESSSNSSSSGQSDNSNNKNSIKYSMMGNEILLQDKTSDWQTAKSEIERLYASWSNVMLDLYKVNVNNQDILNFNSNLDIAVRSNKE